MRKLKPKEESVFSKVTWFIVVAKCDPGDKPPGLHLYFYYFSWPSFLLSYGRITVFSFVLMSQWKILIGGKICYLYQLT